MKVVTNLAEKNDFSSDTDLCIPRAPVSNYLRKDDEVVHNSVASWAQIFDLAHW